MEAAVSANSLETSEHRRKVEVGWTPCGLRRSGRSFGDDTPPITKTPGFEGVTTVFRRVTNPHS
jgi:hypothetical protein